MAVSLFPKKITMKTMGFGVRNLETIARENEPKTVSVCRIWGIISGRTSEMSTLGQFSRYSGEIAAMNLSTGEEARSQQLILPAVAETQINRVYDKASKDGGSAQIALEITVTYNPPRSEDSKITQFIYGVKPLIDFDGEDALSAMGKNLPAPVALKQIEAKPNGASKRR